MNNVVWQNIGCLRNHDTIVILNASNSFLAALSVKFRGKKHALVKFILTKVA